MTLYFVDDVCVDSKAHVVHCECIFFQKGIVNVCVVLFNLKNIVSIIYSFMFCNTTRNVLINDESLMTLTVFVTELVHSMTKLVASSCLISDGALVRRTVTKIESTSLNSETKWS